MFPKLLRLAGRLDLVMSQIKMRDRSKDGAEEEQAMAVYDEGTSYFTHPSFCQHAFIVDTYIHLLVAEEDLTDDAEDMSDEEMMDAMDGEEFDEEEEYVSENASDDEDVDDEDDEEEDEEEAGEGSDAERGEDMDEDL